MTLPRLDCSTTARGIFAASLAMVLAADPLQAASAQRGANRPSPPRALSLEESVDSVRAFARRMAEKYADKERVFFVDLLPTADRGHVVMRRDDGAYQLLREDGSMDTSYAGSHAMLDAMNPGEAAVIYLSLPELLGDRQTLTGLWLALAKSRGINVDKTQFFITLGFDRIRFPNRYTVNQKLVIAVASRDSLLRAVASSRADERRHAAIGLRILADTAAPPALASLLTDSDSAVTIAAVSALLALGTVAADRALVSAGTAVVGPLMGIYDSRPDRLITWLEADSLGQLVRTRAGRALVRMGEPAVPAILARLGESASARSRFLALLSEMGDTGLAILRAAAASGDSAVSTAATRAIDGIERAKAAAAEREARVRRYRPLQLREDSIVTSIKRSGTGARFKVASLRPEPGSCTGSIAVEATEAAGVVVMKTLYPKDRLEFQPTLQGLQQQRCLGPGSIYRFIGRVEFMGVTMTGDADAPLTFMFHPSGFVYLHGRGEIVTREGRRSFR
jgi:hypothetical protein